jgi:hypothetical protein
MVGLFVVVGSWMIQTAVAVSLRLSPQTGDWIQKSDRNYFLIRNAFF